MKQNKKIDELIGELGRDEILNYLNDANQKPFNYTDIKTYEDACKVLEASEEDKLYNTDSKNVVAYKKLIHIYKAINNGWIPGFTNSNQYKYYPYFKVLSSGFNYSFPSYGCVITNTAIGVRLCTDTSAKAEYIGNQFKDIYKDYLL